MRKGCLLTISFPTSGLDGAPCRVNGRLLAGHGARSLAALFIFLVVNWRIATSIVACRQKVCLGLLMLSLQQVFRVYHPLGLQSWNLSVSASDRKAEKQL